MDLKVGNDLGASSVFANLRVVLLITDALQTRPNKLKLLLYDGFKGGK